MLFWRGYCVLKLLLPSAWGKRVAAVKTDRINKTLFYKVKNTIITVSTETSLGKP